MNLKSFVLTGLVAGVVANVYDVAVHVGLLPGLYYSTLTGVFRTDPPMHWLVIGDFVAAFVLTWVWARVHTSFGHGAKAGAIGGLYAGVLVYFPSQIFLHLMLAGFPYSLAWVWTICGIVWSVIVGAVIGALYKP